MLDIKKIREEQPKVEAALEKEWERFHWIK